MTDMPEELDFEGFTGTSS